MMVEYDDEKERLNRGKHGISLELANVLFADRFYEEIDDREDYGEERLIAYGMVAGKVLVCVYTWREGGRRVISLRKATKQETNAYYQVYAG